jgi:low temperature requirement protein LtrA
MTTPAEVMEEREVSPLELFYDLAFAFAVSQLSGHLLDDLTWRGAAETLVLLCAEPHRIFTTNPVSESSAARSTR